MAFLNVSCLKSDSSTFDAPTKLVPLSEYILDGRPLLAVNLRSDAMNASVVNAVTSSICMAFVTKQINSATYAFSVILLRLVPTRTVKGPA